LVKIWKVKDEIFTYPQHPLQTGIILSNEITESDYRFKIKCFDQNFSVAFFVTMLGHEQ